MLTPNEECVLDKVEERLRRGWQQGSAGDFWRDDTDVCLLGAFWSVAKRRQGRMTGTVDSTWRKFNAWIDRRYDGDTLVTFNDEVAETVEDVLLELKLFRESERENAD